MTRSARYVALMVVAMVVLGAAGCSNDDPRDDDYTFACPPPLLFHHPYSEMSIGTEEIPLGRDLGVFDTAACSGSGRDAPLTHVSVRQVLGIPKETAVATVTDGTVHLYVNSNIDPKKRCEVRFVACSSSN